MKTKFGIKSRPHFEIVGWKEAGLQCSREEAPKAALPPASKLEAEPSQIAAPAPQPEPAKAKRKTTTLRAWATSSPSRRARPSTTQSLTKERNGLAGKPAGPFLI